MSIQKKLINSDRKGALPFLKNREEVGDFGKKARLRDATLEKLAGFICGNNVNHFPYRSWGDLTRFFTGAGINYTPNGVSRQDWTLNMLRYLNEQEQAKPGFPSKDLVSVLEYLVAPEQSTSVDQQQKQMELTNYLIKSYNLELKAIDNIGNIKLAFISVPKPERQATQETINRRPILRTSNYLEPKIYMSYYHADRPIAEKIKRVLEHQTDYPEVKISIWFDQEDLFIGDPLTKLPEAIWKSTQAFIALISKDGLTKSKYVREELRIGYIKYILKEKWNFFPIIIGKVSDALMPLYLKTVLYGSYEDSETFFRKLVRDICLKLKKD